jgi:hypothetical protein
MNEDPEKTKSWRFKFPFKNFLLGLSVLLVIYLLISGWQISKVNIGFLELVSPKTVTDNSTNISQVAVTTTLRPLTPLETQQNVVFLPENIYGYAYAFEVSDYQDSMNLSNVCDGYQFEVQKYSGNIYLIGYVSQTDFNAFTAAQSGTKITAYPYNLKNDKKIIAINLKDISDVSDKDIDIDEYTTISTLELTTVSNQMPSEVIEHRAQSCL